MELFERRGDCSRGAGVPAVAIANGSHVYGLLAECCLGQDQLFLLVTGYPYVFIFFGNLCSAELLLSNVKQAQTVAM